MNIQVSEYNTVVNGLKQQLELQRQFTREVTAARDGVMQALQDECKRHQSTKEGAKLLAGSTMSYMEDLDRVLLAVRGEAAALPNSIAGQLIINEAARKQEEINALLGNIDELHAQIAAMKHMHLSEAKAKRAKRKK